MLDALFYVEYPFMPVPGRQLAGNDGCACVGTVISDLQQVSSGLRVHGRHAPIVLAPTCSLQCAVA
jgi:hypothetical protein